jgi:MFS family permease
MRAGRTRLINRDFARLWYGQAISTVGNYVFDTTLVLWVAAVLAKGKPWAPAAVSGILLVAGLAILVVGPVAGVFVDRWDFRVTMMWTEAIRAGLSGLLAIVAFLPVHSLPVWAWLTLIYLDVLALNAVGQFFNPARFAIVGDVVQGEADRARAAGITEATIATAVIIGPPLAAPLLFTVGLQWALLLNAISYVVSYIAIRSVRVAATEPVGVAAAGDSSAEGFWPQLSAGLRQFVTNRYLVALITIAVICTLGTGALNALDVFFVTRNLHSSYDLYGYLGMAFGLGAIVGALSAGRVVQRIGARVTTWLGLLAGGVLIIAYSRQVQFWPGVVMLFLVAVPVTMLNTAIAPMLLAAVPREFLGRTIAFLNPVIQLASMVSVVVAGWLASTVLRNFAGSIGGLHLGPIDTIFTVSGLLIVVAAGYAAVALPRQQAVPAMATA